MRACLGHGVFWLLGHCVLVACHWCVVFPSDFLSSVYLPRPSTGPDCRPRKTGAPGLIGIYMSVPWSGDHGDYGNHVSWEKNGATSWDPLSTWWDPQLRASCEQPAGSSGRVLE